MKKLFEGKRKLITIPLMVLLALVFLPIAIGLGLFWIVNNKVSRSKIKYSLLSVIGVFTLVYGGAWIAAIFTPSQPKTVLEAQARERAQVTLTPQAPTVAVEIRQQPSNTPRQVEAKDLKVGKQEAKITRVVDGDTIEVSINGKKESVRIIGINTPETVDPRKPVECFGERASTVAKERLTGETIWLEADSTQGERDKYNRLLRFVWSDDGTVDFGKVMIASGFAYEYTFNYPYKYQLAYKQAQREAEQDKKGLWADNACPIATAKPTVAPTQSINTNLPENQDSGTCKYSCSGPDRDCSDFSSHAEAQTFFDCCEFTTTNDPMKLDSLGVGDGVACESL